MQGLLNMHMKNATKYVAKWRFCRLNWTSSKGNIKNPPTSLVAHLISQHSLDISPIWTPICEAEVRELQVCPV
jgi:hypothetical protein